MQSWFIIYDIKKGQLINSFEYKDYIPFSIFQKYIVISKRNGTFDVINKSIFEKKLTISVGGPYSDHLPNEMSKDKFVYDIIKKEIVLHLSPNETVLDIKDSCAIIQYSNYYNVGEARGTQLLYYNKNLISTKLLNKYFENNFSY